MKNINKKLYSVIFVCLLLLCFSLNVLATESSNVDTTISSSPEAGDASSDNSEDGASGNESGSLDGEDSSSDSTDVSSGEEDLESTDSDSSDGSDTESESSNQSDASDVSSDETSSKKPSYQGNIGGYVNDEADTSGWGGGEFTSSQLTSAGTTEKKDNKNITNYSALLWILIWIPVLLIFASIGALVYVNRKAFLKQDASFENSNNVYAPKRRKISAAEKAKLKNNHKNRTNVYKPRD